jgi:hypothetical protein
VFNRYKSTLFLHVIDTLKTGNAVFAPSYWAPLSEVTPLFVMGNGVTTVHWQRSGDAISHVLESIALPQFKDRSYTKVQNKKTTRYATLRHQEVCEGDAINLRPNGDADIPDNHIGVFVAIVTIAADTSDEAVYIAYRLPKDDYIIENSSDSDDDDGKGDIFKNLLRNRISTDLMPHRLHIVPISNYIRRVALFHTSLRSVSNNAYAIKLNT